MTILSCILAVILAGFLSAFFYDRYRNIVLSVVSLLFLGIIAYFGSLAGPVLEGATLVQEVIWVDSLNIQLTFLVDGLSLFFALLVTVFGLLIFLYAHRYMKDSPQINRFAAYLLLFSGAMLGLVLSANLIGLFVFWELTSLSSFLLIGFNHTNEDSRRSARQALLITAGGGLALMAGLILLEIATGSGYNLTEILAQPEVVANSGLQSAAIILIALGAITKSAQFPFHFWLPNAMAAPTPVSAYLHSATMVKAGVYLIFRLNPLFQEAMLWHHLLGGAGALTMTWGALKAFQEDDLKRILAYTTLSALGILFMMIGLGGEAAVNAAMVYVLAHALYKCALFMTAGNIDHQTGTRRISQLSDLGRKMPVTATTAVLALASMAGVLPLLGFVGKELLYDALYHAADPMAMVYLALLFLAGALFMAVSVDILYNAFIKTGKLRDQPIREGHLMLILPPLLLAAVSLLTGIAPGWTIAPLLKWSAANIHDFAPSMKLKLWHGFNLVFLLSLATLLSGVGLYFLRNWLRRFQKPSWASADFLYDQAIAGSESVAQFTTGEIQNGYLRRYIATVIVTFSILLLAAMAHGQVFQSLSTAPLLKGLQIYELVILALIALATGFLFRVRSRLIVTATFGIIGYSIALAYTLFSAPDVAITQFLAETLTLILLILIIHRLPSYTLKTPIARLKYLPVAILFGAMMAVTAYVMLLQEKDTGSKAYFLEQSIPKGKGQNAVNVILVDFRALDTLGEITVLTVTMIGIIALLKFKPNNKKA